MSAEDDPSAATVASDAPRDASEHVAVEANDNNVTTQHGGVSHDLVQLDDDAIDRSPFAAQGDAKDHNSGQEDTPQHSQPASGSNAEALSKQQPEDRTHKTDEDQATSPSEAELDSAVNSTTLKLSTTALVDEEAPAPIAKSPVPDVPEKAAANIEAVAHAFGRDSPKSAGSRAISPDPQQTEAVTSAEQEPPAEKERTDLSEGRVPKRKESIPTSQASEEVPFDFNKFLDQMKHRSAAPVGEYVRSFIRGFSRKPYRTNDQIKLINDFLNFINDQMENTVPWSTLSAQEFENAKEAMEKLVMNRLYPFTFSPAIAREGRWPVQTDDLERDSVLAQKMRLFEWVEEKHLDVPVGDHSQGFIDFGVQELLKINHYKAPRDKLICVLNCSKVIFGLIRHLGRGEDADTFLPIFIFIVLRARPDHMISNVEYINRFRSPERLSSESGYYLSSLMGAISFIEGMDYSSFSNLTQEDFEANVEKAAANLARESEESEAKERAASSDGGHGEAGEEEARSIGITPVAAALADDTRAFLQRTGEAARLGMSKPIGAIGRLISDATDGIRTPGSVGTGTGSESAPESLDGQGRASPAPMPPGTPRTRLFGLLGEGGNSNAGNSGRTSGSGFNFPSWSRSSSARGDYDSGDNGPQTPAGVPAMPPQPNGPRRPGLGPDLFDPVEASYQDSPLRDSIAYPGEDLRNRRQLSRIAPGHGSVASPEPSIGELADMSAEVDRVHQERMKAAVETLRGIFPETEHDVCSMVLESCNGDVQAAIDKLLEMS